MVLNSTISINQAATLIWDVIIIGAGPAGSMAAINLARAGKNVLLADKAEHPRSKICGCCLNATAIALLCEIGFDKTLKALNAVPINFLSLGSGRHFVNLQLEGGMALSRTAFDSELILQAITDGVSFLSKTRCVVDGIANGDCRKVAIECEGEESFAKAMCVIVADGLNGQSLSKLQLLPSTTQANSRIGAGAHAIDYPQGLFEPGVIYMTSGSGGYVGMVLLEDGTLDVAAAFDRNFVQSFKNVGEAAAQLIAPTRLAAMGLESLAWQGTPALTRHRPMLSAPRLFVTGDAASYAEPFTGEGMAWALQSAKALVPIVLDLLNSAGAEFDQHAWDREHASLLAGKQYFSMSVARFLRNPFLVRSAIRILNVAPILAAPVIERIGAGSSAQTSSLAAVKKSSILSTAARENISGVKGR